MSVPFGRWVTRLTSCEEWNVAFVAHCILNQLNGVYTKIISSNFMFFLFVSEVDYTLDESIWNEENPVGKY